MRATRFTVLALIAVLLLGSAALFAQNIVSGELTGTVTDPQGAVLPNVPVTLSSDQFGFSQTTNTSSTGFYRFPLLRPGNYKVTVNAPGFAPMSRSLSIAVGQVTTMPLQVSVQASTTTVEVTSEAPLLETENANVTSSYSQKQVELLPNPGQDLTSYALSSPGVVLSTGGGYGNFTAFGLPGTSNLFTMNGNDTNDPFNGLNNSGASNNMLGTNEVQELAIVTNGYTGQYGRAAGANVNYTTKSGSNSFHGNASWWWNGRALNANDFFIKQSGAPRPFANSNQWAGSIGGPIIKDKLFFFYDNEGLRYVLPSGTLTYVPSPQFEAGALATIPGSEIPFYTQVFNLYDAARGRNVSSPVGASTDPALGCADLAGTAAPGGGTFGVDTPCLYSFRSNANSLNTERLQALSIDLVPSSADKVKFRWWQDRGNQATYTDPLTPQFNATSPQPQDTGQVNWTRTIGTNVVNQVILGGSYYSAIFGADVASRTTGSGAALPFPTTIGFFEGSPEPYSLNAFLRRAPQGRNVSQWQAVDDFSWTHGNHNVKLGVNMRHNNITDLTPFVRSFGWLEVGALTDFYTGLTSPNSLLSQRFNSIGEAGFYYYSLGLYAQDEWAITPKLKVTLALRADRNSNEGCKAAGAGCIWRPAGEFSSLTDPTAPYNTMLQQSTQAFPSIEPVVMEPRIGIAYSMFGGRTVLRGGFGVFSDLYPGQLAERFASNAPQSVLFNVLGTGAETIVPDPTAAGSIYNVATGSNAAFTSGFPAGGTFTSIRTAAGGNFSRPALNVAPAEFRNPKYLQWNLELEQAIGGKSALTLNYVGNHGYDEVLINGGVNSACIPAPFSGTGTPSFDPSCGGLGAAPAGFGGLPPVRPNNAFGTTTQLTNNGFSNYNGLTVSFRRRFTKGFTGQVNYTWSHSLDTVSNGGLQQYSFQNLGDSLLAQINPFCVTCNNYGNSDYDFRHNLNANWVWELPGPTHGFLGAVVGGWTYSGTVYARSGAPFSVIDSLINTSFGISNATSLVALANWNGGGLNSCNAPGLDPNNPTICLNGSAFTDPATANSWGNTGRNLFRGPKFVSSDMSLFKSFKITEGGVRMTFGINGYNVFNHPNFNNPDSDLADFPGTFGQILTTAYPASSPYGNFQGASVGGRLFQTMVKFQF